MAFRADEAERTGYERARRYLLSRHIQDDERSRSESAFLDIVDRLGPVVDSYPHWHPLVAAYPDYLSPITTPRPESGYEGLDHTVYFAKGFITCPYHGEQRVIDAVEKLPEHPLVTITAERVGAQLYHCAARPVVVCCEWRRALPPDGMIPKSWAVPLILELELPCWRSAHLAESWETMRPYFLGCPHGRRSSLFINQETGQVIKSIWNALIHTGMFGPIRTDFAGRPSDLPELTP